MLLATALLLLAPAAAEQPAAAPTPAPAEKLICKKSLETGSLVKARKTCLTAKQWRLAQESASNTALRMQSENSRLEGTN
ncbi:MAG: hypothetical protein DI623_15775 [Sphingomonas sanxanigenens]|uniref:Uncharacterized protein n=1 Tax=Sphingomonas sanxanigenens TaxID=397260 RepID=A0A2W4ZX42_9SPHN|nr:MAG: hypothetical protein DI623_15775 [Sphingomonas sanxanigenens]